MDNLNLSNEHILLLGATGVSGQTLIREALLLPSTHQPKITLYVRNASRLEEAFQHHASLRIIEGTLSDAAAIGRALNSTDSRFGTVTTVVSVLGAYLSFKNTFWDRSTATPIADALKGTVLPACQKAGVRRVLALSTPAALEVPGERQAELGWVWTVSLKIPPLFTPMGNAEMVGIARAVLEAGVGTGEDTVFRVPHLNDGDAGLEVAAGTLGSDFRGGSELSRASMCRWLLREIVDRKWCGKTPVIGNV